MVNFHTENARATAGTHKPYNEEDNGYRFPDKHPLQQGQAVRIAT